MSYQLLVVLLIISVALNIITLGRAYVRARRARRLREIKAIYAGLFIRNVQ